VVKATPRTSSAGRVWTRIASQTGFTLFELLVILIIVGLVTSITIPRLTGSLDFLYERNALRGAAAMMRQARLEAAFRKETMAVTVDKEKGFLVLSREEDAAAVAKYGGLDPSSSKAASGDRETGRLFVPIRLDLPERLRIASVNVHALGEGGKGIYMFVFYPLGTSNGGQIEFEDSNRTVRRIRISPLTGKVRILQDDEDV